MISFTSVKNLYKRLRAPGRAEQELESEVQSYLEIIVERHVARGLPVEEARRRARLQLDGAEQIKHCVREARMGTTIESVLEDIRYALRGMRNNPAISSVALLSLALGIGANTAIFSLVNAVLLKSLPVQRPEQLVILDCLSKNGGRGAFSHTDFGWIRDRNRVFDGVLASSGWRVDWEHDGRKEQIQTSIVSGNFFSVLGVQTALGRSFTDHDDKTGKPVALISYEFWRNRFGQSSQVLSKSLTLANTAVEIVGVAPPEFFGVAVGDRPDVWVPLSMQPRLNHAHSFLNTRNVGWLELMARLKPAVTREKAQLSLAVLYSAVRADLHIDPQNDSLNRVGVSPGAGGFSDLRVQYSQPLHILMAIVILVLLIACANVSNLLLARAASRQREFAVRLALGAARVRIVLQLLTEALVMSCVAGVLGLSLVLPIARLLLHFAGATTIEITLNWMLLGFTMAVCLLTAILFGVVPSLRGANTDPGHTTKLDSRSAGESTSQKRFSDALIVLQIAMSFVLLHSSGLLITSLKHLRAANPGFDRASVVQAQIDPGAADYQPEQTADLSNRLVDRLRTLPGVESASASSFSFGTGASRTCCVNVYGRTPGQPPAKNEDTVVRTQEVAPDYFKTLGIPLLTGRDFASSDTARKPDVAIINETMARQYFGRANPVGRRFGWEPAEAKNIEIIGVAEDARYDNLRERTPPMVYRSLLQHPNEPQYLSVRVASGSYADSASILAGIRGAIKQVDPNIPVMSISTMGAVVNRSLGEETALAQMASAFGLLAALLAAIGIYGVLSYAVTRRTNEIGIRMALGAQQRSIRLNVLRGTLLLCLAGLGIGLLAVFIAGHLMASVLFHLNPTDPVIIFLSAFSMLMLSLASGLLPAVHASKIDPMAALRHE